MPVGLLAANCISRQSRDAQVVEPDAAGQIFALAQRRHVQRNDGLRGFAADGRERPDRTFANPDTS